MNIELQEGEVLITSQEQFIDKFNELLANGYTINEKHEDVLVDVAIWGNEYFQYEKIASEKKPLIDILLIKIIEEHKLFMICTKRYINPLV